MPGLLEALFGPGGGQPQPQGYPDWLAPIPQPQDRGLLGNLLGGMGQNYGMMGYLAGALQPGTTSQRIARGLQGQMQGALVDIQNQTRLDALNKERAEQRALIPQIDALVRKGIMTPAEANVALWNPAYRTAIGTYLGQQPGAAVQRGASDEAASIFRGGAPAPATPAPAPTSGPRSDLPLPSPGLMKAITTLESGGNYNAVGNETKTGDRAYGRYQVMGANIPTWSQEILGVRLTPQQFLADPRAQDAIAHAKLGEYERKYGTEGAGRAWFAGERGMNNPNATDVNGMTVARYGQRVAQLSGQPPGGAPQAALPAQTTAPAAAPAQPTVAPVAAPAPAPAPAPLQTPPLGQTFKTPFGDLTEDQMNARINQMRQLELNKDLPAESKKALGEQIKAMEDQIKTARGAATALGKETYDKTVTEIMKGATAANAAAEALNSSKELRRVMDSPGGIFTGQFAEYKLSGAKTLKEVGNLFGRDWGQDAIANTETFQSVVGQQVAALVKNFGSAQSITDSDREFAAKMAAGKITLDEAAIRRVMDINDKISRERIEKHNNLVDQTVKRVGQPAAGLLESKVAMPEAYKAPTQIQTPGSPKAAPGAPGTATAAPVVPKVGEVRGGYRFMGGNPADSKNWQLVGGI